MSRWIILLAIFVGAIDAQAESLAGVEFAKLRTVGNFDLKLNGLGLRRVYRFGIPIKVYVAGLYLMTRANSPEAIMQQSTLKSLELKFVQRVDKSDMEKAFREAYRKNCGETCESTNDSLKEFLKMQVDMLSGSGMTFDFFMDRVDVEIHGRSKAKKSIGGKEFSQNLLAVFIGPHPPNPELKSGLLGQK